MQDRDRPDLTIAGFDPWRELTHTYYDHQLQTEVTETFHYDHDLGQRVIDFGERHLCHALDKWQNQPLVLTEWQRRLIHVLFGFVDSKGRRRFNELFLTCARKAGKSTLMTLLAWWFAACEPVNGQRVVLCANSVEQANESLWTTILWQYHANPKLKSKFRHNKGTYKLFNAERNNVLSLTSANGAKKHGGSPTLVIFDELSWSKNNDLYVALASGTGARENALAVTCSTVSHITDNIFHDQLERARKIRDGQQSDPRFLPVVFELPKDADWRDRSLWPLSNPNLLELGLPTDLEAEFTKANTMPSYEAEFRMTKLNQVVSSKNLWLPVHQFDTHDHAWPDDIEHQPGVIGVDLSTSQDITSWCATYFRDGTLYVDPFYYIPADNIEERVRSHKFRFDTYADEANPVQLTATPGNVIDYETVSNDIIRYLTTHTIEIVYFDRHKWTSVIQAVAKTGVECVGVSQGFAGLNAACHEFERLFTTNNVVVKGRCPVYRWMLSNAHVQTNRGGEITIVKPKHQDYLKIDAIAATLNTVMHHIRLAEPVIDFDLAIPT